ncbi:hypothetical protein MNEG_10166 [Monoraphidium neglectum]|uniref:Uncharacterized protein n=1 Tax=Monoraphidium neglectum TaxID=145388 RepID=A0A0D2MA11_9CHLO|nr:hypothetical protein MNEG_10166 [Monoraphidium neglectum]KIY97796.1 hypothetical protein MNEG_10166 [Monoraphidium neglectum]|eukprot:XP_013896816.1 hypothetical protein MNEG_10166 [Monoraphidium neglectum]
MPLQSRRYLYHLSTIKNSRIVRGLLRPVMVIVAVATAVCSYHTIFALRWLPAFMPALPLVPIEPFQLTSFALALLLVFRTNGAYQRWHEARCVFGRIADSARDIWRQVLAVFPRDRPEARAMLGRWLVAYTFACKWALREEGRQRADLEGWLEPRELDGLMAARDPPHYAMLVMSHVLKNNLSGQQLVMLMHEIGSMMYSLSSCTRILTTPIPLSYTVRPLAPAPLPPSAAAGNGSCRHTTRFMALWLLLLPLALWAKCGWGCVPAAALVSLALLTIEAIGVSLEEPFSILALEQICERLGTGIANLAAMDDDAYAAARMYAAESLLSYPAAAAAAGVPAPAAAAPAEHAAADGGHGAAGDAVGGHAHEVGGGAPALYVSAGAAAVTATAAAAGGDAGGSPLPLEPAALR